jgi:pimeloyl-ACP methyl ester carboxylesterase
MERGSGQPIVLLHGAGGPKHVGPFLDALEQHGRIIAPSHPGFGRTELPDWFEGVDDLAYLYLDLLDQLDLRDVILLGFSMGGWTAAEIAVRCTHRLKKLILVAPVGIKVGDRLTRDIPDIYALPPDEVVKLTYHDPSKATSPKTMTDEQLAEVARNREAAVHYLWEPYMHNPQLRRRLHRINVPTLLLRGASDGLVSADYARAYAQSIPGARLETIERAGHVLQLEQPQELADRIVRFIAER